MRRSVVISLVLIAFVVPAIAQTATQTGSGPWVRQQAGTLAWLRSVFFLDHNRGWAVGSKGTLLTTVDGGKNWKFAAAPTTAIVRDIFFLDEKTGWLVCEENIYELTKKEQTRAFMMKTTDGGENWNRVELEGIDVNSALVRAVFSRGGRGWAFGENGLIYTTRDFGETWAPLVSPTRRLLLGGFFVDDDRGWIVGAGATIIQTSDGGETWYQSRLPQVDKSVRFTAASFVDNRLGWAVGSGGAVYHTTNGGRTWQKQETGVYTDLLDVKFVDAREGWAVGTEGTIIHTVNGGVRWTSERSETQHPLERVFFTDKTRGWAVGFGGTVVAYLKQ